MTYQQFIIAISNLANRVGLRRLQRIIRIGAFGFIGCFFKRKTTCPPDFQQVKNLLIVRQHNQMGDMLCSTPVFRALRQHFPEAHITLVAGDENYEVVQGHPDLDDMIVYHKLSFLAAPIGFWKFLKTLRQRKYELGVVLSTVSMSVTSDVICWLSGASHRVGVDKLNGVKNPTGFLFNIPVEMDWRGSRKHHTERNLDILRAVGLNPNESTISMGVSREDEQSAEEFIQTLPGMSRFIVGIHPGAGKISNQWEAEKFSKIADYIVCQYGASIVVTCGPMDERPVAAMVRAMKQPFVVCKGRSIPRIAAILKRMNLFITNDTGIMHVAAAVGVPTLSLFGPTDSRQWAPQGKQHRFIQSSDGKIASISVEKVIRTIDEMFKNPDFGAL